MNSFERYLFDDIGLESKSVTTYRNAVTHILDTHPGEPWRVLERRDLTKRSKVVYRAALRHWARYTDDGGLEEALGSVEVQRALRQRDGKPPKRVVSLTAQEVEMFLDELERQRLVLAPWQWPCTRLLVDLALRAQVDLTWITREAVDEALANGHLLTLVSKGARERSVPYGHGRAPEALEELQALPGWSVLADLIAGHKDPAKKHERAYGRVRRLLKAIARDAGLNPAKIHPHRFRHAAASWLYKETGDIQLVRALLGHQSAVTTEQYLSLDRTADLAAHLRERFDS